MLVTPLLSVQWFFILFWKVPRTLGFYFFDTSFSGFIPRQSLPPISFFLFLKKGGNGEFGGLKGRSLGLPLIYSNSFLKVIVHGVFSKYVGVPFFPLGLHKILLRLISQKVAKPPFGGF